VCSEYSAERKRSPSGFGALHLAVLSLAARVFDDANREERSLEVRRGLLEMNQVILAYLVETTTGLKANAGQPVFVTGASGAGKYVGGYTASRFTDSSFGPFIANGGGFPGESSRERASAVQRI
jgi:ABC-type multidrug transport system fused ATPase/permease subunit